MDYVMVNILSLLMLFYCCSLGGGTAQNRTVRQSCGNKFPCSRGGCTESSDVCNGMPQCNDASDESPEACECGLSNFNAVRDIGRGIHDAKVGQHPWHVGVYKTRLLDSHYTLICSGVLIYSNIVLTSANCVFDPDGFHPYSASTLYVSAGKIKRDYLIDEGNQQTFSVSKVLILPRYDGDTKGFAKNLAILKIKKHAEKTPVVRPICLVSSKVFPKDIARAAVTGWGLRSSGTYATNLRQASVAFMDAGRCIQKYSDPLFKRFITNDKFCTTFEDGVGLKDDDTGGPVTIFKDGRHFLLGVLSVKLDGADFGIVTKISKHIDWIKNTTYHLKKNEECLQGKHFNCESDNECIGMYQVCDGVKDCLDGSDEDAVRCATIQSAEPTGSLCDLPEGREIMEVLNCGGRRDSCTSRKVPSSSTFRLTCPRNFGFAKPNTQEVSVVCIDGKWFPPIEENRCLKLCPPLEIKSLDLKCHYLGTKVPCSQPLKPNTQVLINCKLHYKKEIGANFAEQTTCRRDGELHHILTECTPVCGKEYNANADLLISEGVKLKYAKYPWHVALYHKSDSEDADSYIFQCGASLIGTNKVLTAAHCVWDQSLNIVKMPQDVAVACGKYHSSWFVKDPWQQKVGVKRIIPGIHYNGGKTRHAKDIAVLILNHDVVLSDYVMPVCLDLDNIAGGIPPNQPGHIVGWGRLKETDTQSSDVLWESKMDYLDLESCRKRFSQKYNLFEGYLHSDKFCGLYRDGSGTQKGDSGGGLTFIHNGLYYVYGIVSIKQPGQNIFAAFTNVASHSQWLKDILNNII